jgi:NAD(P)-dependent dehydrogenase (short-subunit alcohol dehydrogenase family)
MLAGRRRDALEETAALAQSDGGRGLVVPTDIAEPLAVKALFGTVEAEFERLDLLFNNAGIGAPSVSSQAPRPLFGPYTISKHAITGLTRSTALDGRPFDIACG